MDSGVDCLPDVKVLHNSLPARKKKKSEAEISGTTPEFVPHSLINRNIGVNLSNAFESKALVSVADSTTKSSKISPSLSSVDIPNGAMADSHDASPFKKRQRMSLCFGCGDQIYDQYILRVSPDLEWHAACLKCTECHQYLDETCTCFVKDGKTYCKCDYLRLFGAKCAKCCEGFSKDDFVMRARSKIYHVDCFKCIACSKKLITGDEFALRDDGLFCKADHEVLEKNGLHSTRSDLPAINGSSFHGRASMGTPLAQSSDINGNNISPTNSNSNSSGSQLQMAGSAEPMQSNRHRDSVRPQVHKHNSEHKPTRVRTVLNEKQLHTLRTCYNANPRPDALMKEQLVEMTGLSPRVIRVWFQNKRCKDKKKSIMMKQMQQQEKLAFVARLMTDSDYTPHSSPVGRLCIYTPFDTNTCIMLLLEYSLMYMRIIEDRKTQQQRCTAYIDGRQLQNIASMRGVPLVATSPVRHESPVQHPIEVQTYHPPWKTLADYALQPDCDPNAPHFQQIVSQNLLQLYVMKLDHLCGAVIDQEFSSSRSERKREAFKPNGREGQTRAQSVQVENSQERDELLKVVSVELFRQVDNFVEKQLEASHLCAPLSTSAIHGYDVPPHLTAPGDGTHMVPLHGGPPTGPCTPLSYLEQDLHQPPSNLSSQIPGTPSELSSPCTSE
ncbi:LIM class homeodomain transcription factor: islet subclass-like protein [Dinothrombium tinctorium]|uniref:Insulin gene enhancer protein ISL-1 n=1 Tax=Dinothrombium tinctorium TaxID=1965070 RepID=A0A443RLZ3_9ACAR|nr:LIM class homeodomain transcription factor: islet subclass-like protein [Dinothrombium tinctorium]